MRAARTGAEPNPPYAHAPCHLLPGTCYLSPLPFPRVVSSIVCKFRDRAILPAVVLMGEDANDPLTTSIVEAAHRVGSAAHFAEAAFNGVGGAKLLRARWAGSAKKLSSSSRSFSTHATAAGASFTPGFCPTPVPFSGFGAVLGLVDSAQLRKAAFSLFRQEPAQQVSHLVYPAPLAFHMPVDHLQSLHGARRPRQRSIRRNLLPSRPRL